MKPQKRTRRTFDSYSGHYYSEEYFVVVQQNKFNGNYEEIEVYPHFYIIFFSLLAFIGLIIYFIN